MGHRAILATILSGPTNLLAEDPIFMNCHLSRSFSPDKPYFLKLVVALSLAALPLTWGCNAVPESDQAGALYIPRESSQDLAGAPAPSAAPGGFAADNDGESTASESLPRDIEEADIVKIVGDTLYALNRYKGLLIVDVADPDAPALKGSLDLKGRGVEMYVIGAQAFVLLSADYYFYAYDVAVGTGGDVALASNGMTIAPDGPIPPRPDFEGSQLAVVDVSDPAAPSIEGKINLVGFANESRRVGDVIYVIGSNLNQYYFDYSDTAGTGFVASINVADPDDIQAVERKEISGQGVNMHASETTIFAGSQFYDSDSSQSYTRIQVIDISDSGGAIVLRDVFDVPGNIRNRFYMDDFNGTFRIATVSWGFGFQEVRLFTYDLSDLDDVQPLGQTPIIQNESLEAVRFDGVRGYAVTFLRVDPLFVIDLRDPANPQVTGELEVPGFSTHIEPRGNRLIAVGIDDTDGTRPAVAYYDVEDPANPTQLGRVILGPPGSYTSSEATYDEKAFKIVDELGLIAIPFYHIDYSTMPGGIEPDGTEPAIMPVPGGSPGAAARDDYFQGPTCTSGVQLIDFSDTALTQRGAFDTRGVVSRVGVLGDRVFALSESSLQTFDINDRDNPEKRGDLTFFPGDEMAMFDQCGYYGWPFEVDPGFNGGGANIFIFLDEGAVQALFSMLESCGAMGGAAAFMTVGGLFAMSKRVRRRRH